MTSPGGTNNDSRTQLRSAPVSWYLESLATDRKKEFHPLSGEVSIGRVGCDILLTSEHASRNHAKIIVSETMIALKDADSTNGVYVNEQRIKGIIELSEGDTVRFDTEGFVLARRATSFVANRTPVTPPAIASEQVLAMEVAPVSMPGPGLTPAAEAAAELSKFEPLSAAEKLALSELEPASEIIAEQEVAPDPRQAPQPESESNAPKRLPLDSEVKPEASESELLPPIILKSETKSGPDSNPPPEPVSDAPKRLPLGSEVKPDVSEPEPPPAIILKPETKGSSDSDPSPEPESDAPKRLPLGSEVKPGVSEPEPPSAVISKPDTKSSPDSDPSPEPESDAPKNLPPSNEEKLAVSESEPPSAVISKSEVKPDPDSQLEPKIEAPKFQPISAAEKLASSELEPLKPIFSTPEVVPEIDSDPEPESEFESEVTPERDTEFEFEIESDLRQESNVSVSSGSAWYEKDSPNHTAKFTRSAHPGGAPSGGTQIVQNLGKIEQPSLVGVGGDWAGKIFTLEKTSTRVARSGADINLNEPGVSIPHANIEREDNRWKIVDLMSRNGVYVNGSKTSSSYLSSGDAIRFGRLEFRFVIDSKDLAPKLDVPKDSFITGTRKSVKQSSNVKYLVLGFIIVLAAGAYFLYSS